MNQNLPTAFVEWLRRAFSQTHFTPDYVRKLALQQLARWRDGEESCAIPGYDTPPPDAGGFDAPEGWESSVFWEVRDSTLADRTVTGSNRSASVVHYV